MSFEELSEVMLLEYYSNARRLAIRSDLKILTIQQFMADNTIIDDAAGLTKIVDHINSLVPQ